ncbi:MAG: amidoligase family protein [Halioglobus sp.]|nr:amidoligase family protein [Halioglobus sp.]
MSGRYLLPPALLDTGGRGRKAGFEFEFGHLSVLQTAEALQASLGGELEVKTPFEVTLRESAMGRLKIERDADILKSVKYRRWMEQLGVEFEPGTLAHDIEANIDTASALLIPCEVVTEPIPFTELERLDTLIAALNTLGAEGTQDSLMYAFGMHINPDVPATDAGTLRRYLQAFLLLHTWIIEISGTDITRRFLTKYIDPFPQPYLELVLAPDYRPDRAAFMSDYLEHNPTRNRALDLLPVLCDLDSEWVLQVINEEERELVKGRPAFHYRLPDCRLNAPGWTPAEPWNEWVYVEKLAADEALLQELVGAWQENNATFSIAPKTNWALHLTSLLSRKFFER